MRKKIAKCISDKGLVSRIYKEVSKFNSKKTNDLFFLMVKRFEQVFTKKDMWAANKHMKRCSTSLVNINLSDNEVMLHTN